MRSFELSLNAFALICAWGFAYYCWSVDRSSGTDFFARSGSVLVLVSVIIEYRLLSSRSAYHSRQLSALKVGREVDFSEQHPSKQHGWLETLAHGSVIFGTLIWGYGDLVV